MIEDAVDGLPSAVRRRLRDRRADDRLAHVESVVAVVEETVAAWGWASNDAVRATRAAWYHDALKADRQETWLDLIAEAGDDPDAWVVRYAPGLLHAHAGAAWAITRWQETDAEVLAAVRHHPTAHPEWGALGWLLFVADFCEPGRVFAGRVQTAEMLETARSDQNALPGVAMRVLGRRLQWMVQKGRRVHPLSERALERLERTS